MEIMMLKGLGKLWIIRLDCVGIGFISIYEKRTHLFLCNDTNLPKQRIYEKSYKMIENLGFPPLYSQIDKEKTVSLCQCKKSLVLAKTVI